MFKSKFFFALEKFCLNEFKRSVRRRVEALLSMSLDRCDLTGLVSRSPLGMKWWSLQVFKKEMWQEYVASFSVRMEEVLA